MGKRRKHKPLKCGFCGKTQHEVKRLIAGMKRGSIVCCICDECIECCEMILRETHQDQVSEAPGLVTTHDK